MKHRVETEPWQFLYEETIGQVNWRSKINDVSYLNEAEGRIIGSSRIIFRGKTQLSLEDQSEDFIIQASVER